MATSASENSLHVWRSRSLDAFAKAKTVVDLLLRKVNAPAKGEMISAKIERLRKAKHSGALNEERKKKIDQVLVELATLLSLRNDLVHSPMKITKDGEHTIACFTNPNLQCEYSSFARTITGPRLQALASKVSNLAKALETA